MDEAVRHYERLGYFYLGKKVGLDTEPENDELLLYKSRDLTTHAAIIGMTGSGKTGLGVSLIEEAAIDNIPALIIDPKGDMGNLLLAFPQLRPEDFAPWLDAAEAERKGCSLEQLAVDTADLWRNGLAQWAQPPERISAFAADRDISIYTPGSSAGRQLSLLAGFDAPPAELIADGDAFAALVKTTVTSLLAFIDVEADPLQSPEYLLLATLFSHFWRNGENLSLEGLIGQVAQPPFRKLGVLPLDSVYPQNKRLELAMRLNNILSNPGFSAWTEGEPLDIGQLLFDAHGKARVTILSIAHLSDNERMFFVTLLLNRFISWMRRQSGSTSLRALLYMDEVFGYVPATANPPSKEPMLLLIKQARAFGVGIVLATQNPVDLDYKGLANIGSWFLGRLQTRQDVERVINGLVSGSENTDRQHYANLLTGLKSRHFLLKNAKDDQPQLFETRWALSYLRGPITRQEIMQLMAGRKEPSAAVTQPAVTALVGQDAPDHAHAPVLSAQIPQLYTSGLATGAVRCYPALYARGEVRFYNQSRAIDQHQAVIRKLDLTPELRQVDWSTAETLESAEQTLLAAPAGARYLPLPSWLSAATSLRDIEKEFADYLYRNSSLPLYRCRTLKLESRPGDSQQDFQLQVAGALREQRDAAVEKLQKSYAAKEDRLQARRERAVIKLEKEQEDVSAKTGDTMINAGLTLVGALFGGKLFSRGSASRAAGTLRSGSRILQEKQDVKRAQEELPRIDGEIAALADQLEEEIDAMGERFAPDSVTVEPFAITPRRGDIRIEELALLWEVAL